MTALRDELRLERLEARAVAWLADARTPGEIAWRLATWLLLGYAALQAAHAYATGFDGPLLDRHSFRQTQTAISAYWIAHGGPLVAYETPVFGAPYPHPSSSRSTSGSSRFCRRSRASRSTRWGGR